MEALEFIYGHFWATLVFLLVIFGGIYELIQAARKDR